MIKDCPPSGCKLSSPGYPGLPPQVGFNNNHFDDNRCISGFNNHFDDNRFNTALIIILMIIVIIVVGFINIMAITIITMILNNCTAYIKAT